MPDARQMNAYLVRTSRTDAYTQIAAARVLAQHFIFGIRAAAFRQLRRHARAMDGVARDRFLDHSARTLKRPCTAGQYTLRIWREANCAASARCARSLRATSSTPLVYRSRRCTMPGAFAANLRQRLKAMQQCVDERALMHAGAGMHHHARRFIDRDHILVFVQDVSGRSSAVACSGGRSAGCTSLPRPSESTRVSRRGRSPAHVPPLAQLCKRARLYCGISCASP